MAGFDVQHHSKSQVANAGKVLANKFGYPYPEEAVGAFRVAHDWRAAHMVPMRRVHIDLCKKAHKIISADGFTSAARLKRMASIRRKLPNYSLYSIQDIAGCRAIVDSMDAVRAIADAFRQDANGHGIRREDDYIAKPKRGGYRSQHLVLKFNGKEGEAQFSRQAVEVQIRTRLQHAWATAVEAMGLIRSEHLKGGEGNPDWLRFFELVSAEFALEEGCAIEASLDPDHAGRLGELRALEGKLKAAATLEKYNQAIKFTDEVRGDYTKYFLIQYDATKNEVIVRPATSFAKISAEYLKADMQQHDRNAVLVEVNNLQELKVAYPNYFMDVQMFTDRVKRIVGLDAAQAMAQAPATKTKIDLSWWKWGR